MADQKPNQAKGDAQTPPKREVRSFEAVRDLTQSLLTSLTTPARDAAPRRAASPTPTPTQRATPTTPTPSPAAKPKLLPPAEVAPSRPNRFFFYGSLMDPDVLYFVSRATAEPVLHRATIRGYRMKRWGRYPALVPGGPGDVVSGVYWEAESAGQLALLQHYETGAYRPAACAIRVERDGDGGVVVEEEEGLTFVWAGDAGSEELVEGGFDLEEYRLYYKPDMFVRDN